jgi:hypothetical protein
LHRYTTAESKPAATALVNLTGLPEIATLAVEKGAVERAMEFLRDPLEFAPPELLMMLLANVTNTEGGVHVFSQEGKSLEGFFVMKLVQMLADSKPSKSYDHAASVVGLAKHFCCFWFLLQSTRQLIAASMGHVTNLLQHPRE